MDLLTYLQTFEPQELVMQPDGTCCTREHDSLQISNGKWYWFSRETGGRSALDYLIKVKGLSFPQAVERLTGTAAGPSQPETREGMKAPRVLQMPETVFPPDRAKKYLAGRGIAPEIIDFCIERGLLLETAEYHNAVFLGFDGKGTPRYGAVRGTAADFKSEFTGSDKRWSFSLPGNGEPEHLHLFESAIDLLSFATLERGAGRDWQRDALLSLGGISKRAHPGYVPLALRQFLTDHPQVTVLHLHLDTDEAGRCAAAELMNSLSESYAVLDEPPACGKDVNDQLQLSLSAPGAGKERAR